MPRRSLQIQDIIKDTQKKYRQEKEVKKKQEEERRKSQEMIKKKYEEFNENVSKKVRVLDKLIVLD
jgi:ClpP class serine protease